MHAGQSLMDVRLSQKSIKNMCKAVSPCDFFFVLFLISIQTQKALSVSCTAQFNTRPGPMQGQDFLSLLIPSITLHSQSFLYATSLWPTLHPETQALCVSHMTPLWFFRNSGNYVTWNNVERGQNYS